MSTKMKGKASQLERAASRTNGDHLRRSLEWVLTERIFADVEVRGNVSWTAVNLVRLAIFWVWSNESTLTAAADESIRSVRLIFGSVAVRSYQALVGALKRYTVVLLPLLWRRLQQLMQQCDPET